jgi:hypothetical protein
MDVSALRPGLGRIASRDRRGVRDLGNRARSPPVTMTAPAPAWQDMVPVLCLVHCDACSRPVELSCSGLGGTVMYRTFNEYLCPSCGGRNYAYTPGNILSARAPNLTA